MLAEGAARKVKQAGNPVPVPPWRSGDGCFFVALLHCSLEATTSTSEGLGGRWRGTARAAHHNKAERGGRLAESGGRTGGWSRASSAPARALLLVALSRFAHSRTPARCSRAVSPRRVQLPPNQTPPTSRRGRTQGSALVPSICRSGACTLRLSSRARKLSTARGCALALALWFLVSCARAPTCSHQTTLCVAQMYGIRVRMA